MGRAGVRELKNRLSEYLRRVAAGEIIEVTDHGRVVAELRPPGLPSPAGEASLPIRYWERVARGELQPGPLSNHPDLYRDEAERLLEGTARKLLDLERGE